MIQLYSSVTCSVPLAVFIVHLLPHNIQDHRKDRKHVQHTASGDLSLVVCH